MPRSGLATVAADTGGRSGEVTRTMVSLAVLGIVVPLVVVDWGSNAASIVNVLLAMAIVLFSATRLARMIGTGRPDMFRAFFYLFVYIFLGLATLAQVVAGQFPQDERSYLDDTVTEGLLLVMVGIVGYEIGWLLWRRRVREPEQPPEAPFPLRGPSSRWYFSRPRVVVVGLLSLGAATYQIAANGIATFFTSRSETTSALTGAGDGLPAHMSSDKSLGLITVFVTQVPLLVVLFLVLYCRHHKLWPTSRSLVTDGLWRLFILLLLARMSRVPWNFGGGPVIIRRPRRCQYARWHRQVR